MGLFCLFVHFVSIKVFYRRVDRTPKCQLCWRTVRHGPACRTFILLQIIAHHAGHFLTINWLNLRKKKMPERMPDSRSVMPDGLSVMPEGRMWCRTWCRTVCRKAGLYAGPYAGRPECDAGQPECDAGRAGPYACRTVCRTVCRTICRTVYLNILQLCQTNMPDVPDVYFAFRPASPASVGILEFCPPFCSIRFALYLLYSSSVINNEYNDKSEHKLKTCRTWRYYRLPSFARLKPDIHFLYLP